MFARFNLPNQIVTTAKAIQIDSRGISHLQFAFIEMNIFKKWYLIVLQYTGVM